MTETLIHLIDYVENQNYKQTNTEFPVIHAVKLLCSQVIDFLNYFMPGLIRHLAESFESLARESQTERMFNFNKDRNISVLIIW